MAGMSLEDFKADDKTASAVIRKFEIIGEAAKHVPEDIKSSYSEVAWKEMAGMRDQLIHAYMDINYRLVWKTVHEDLPSAKASIEQILKENP